MNSFNIKHRPILDTARAAEQYSNKDGVPVKYVCTSALDDGTLAADIFFRESPHPDFGNRYFGLYLDRRPGDPRIMITGADRIEDLEFAMIEDTDSGLIYSQHRHDFVTVGGDDYDAEASFIDGGRSYIRCGGLPLPTVRTFKIVDGEFVLIEGNDD
jgi:hypothetical protein